MAQVDIQYGQLLQAIMDYGYEYTTENRKGVICKQISSAMLNLELTEFPMVTTKEMYLKGIVGELLWFLKGDTNIKWLVDNNINIWNKDAYTWYVKEYQESGYSEQNMHDIKDWLTYVVAGERPHNTDDFQIAGDVGRNYGAQWTNWQGPDRAKEGLEGINQIQVLIDNLRKDNPINRRHIVTAWNPAETGETALPACHWAFEILPRPLTVADKVKFSGGDIVYLDGLWTQAYTKNDDEANEILKKEIAHVPDYGFTLKWHQRSVDTFLGLPFNIASYGVLAMIIGRLTMMKPLEIIGDLSNIHIYEPHFKAVTEQLKNDPNRHSGCGFEITAKGEPKFEEFDKHGNVYLLMEQLEIDDFTFPGYESYDKVSAEMIAQDDN